MKLVVLFIKRAERFWVYCCCGLSVCLLLPTRACAGESEKKVLVIVLAETRAHELTYSNFQENVLDPLNADLAICIGVTDDYRYDNPFYRKAKYKFLYPEVEDYGPAFDYAYANILADNPQMKNPIHWRNFLKIKDQFMGGVKDPYNQHPGSAGILIFYRWFLLKNLLEADLLDKYDFFIITRSDYIYRLPHPRMEIFSDELIYAPDGEAYSGITDRHIVLPSKFVVPYLSLLSAMVDQKNHYYDLMKVRGNWNLEQLIKFHLVQSNIWEYVRFFPYVMYTVRPINGTTRWSSGVFSEQHQFFIKYPSEYQTALDHKLVFEGSNCGIDFFYKNRLREPDDSKRAPANFSQIKRKRRVRR